MAEEISAIKSSSQENSELAGLESGAYRSNAQAYDTLQELALQNMSDLRAGQGSSTKAIAKTAFSEQLFDKEKGAKTASSLFSNGQLAMLDDKATNDTVAEKAKTATVKSNPPKPTDEVYKRSLLGKPIPVYSYKDTVPYTSRAWNADTGEFKETYSQVSGVKDPKQKYGGVVLETETSQTVAFRGEATIDNKPGRKIELTNFKGISGYGSNLGFTGETPVHSVKMWQVQTGKDDKGNPIYESFQEAVIGKVDWKGTPIINKETGKQDLETRKQAMLNEDFNLKYDRLDPAVLAQWSIKEAAKVGS